MRHRGKGFGVVEASLGERGGEADVVERLFWGRAGAFDVVEGYFWEPAKSIDDVERLRSGPAESIDDVRHSARVFQKPPDHVGGGFSQARMSAEHVERSCRGRGKGLNNAGRSFRTVRIVPDAGLPVSTHCLEWEVTWHS